MPYDVEKDFEKPFKRMTGGSLLTKKPRSTKEILADARRVLEKSRTFEDNMITEEYLTKKEQLQAAFILIFLHLLGWWCGAAVF